MADRYEVYVVRKVEGREKPFWHKVGIAFPMKQRDGFSIKLDYPVGVNEFVLMPPKERDGGGYGSGQQQQSGGSDGGDSIPFGPLLGI